jgi:adhesin transport system outer membrane protein
VRTRFMISTCVGALLALSVSSASNAASLESELSGMLQDHPNLKAARQTSKSAEKEIDVQKAGNLPTVSFSSDYGYEWISNATTRSSNSDGHSGLMRRVAGLTVTQNLYDGNATSSAIRTAKLSKMETDLTETNTRQSLLLEGIQVYLEVLKQARRIEYARDNEANIKTQMELEDERVQRGSGIGIDVLNAKSRLQTAKDKRVEYEGDLARAADQYMQVFGHAPDLAAMIDPNPPMQLMPEDLDSAIELALKENANLVRADIAAEKAAENKNTVRAEYYPTVDLKGSMNYENDKSATIGTRRDWSMLIEANWDLFSGFSTDNSMRKAIFDYEASKASYEYLARKTIEATRQAWHLFETTQERLDLKQNDLILKEEIFLDTRKQRENGAEGVDVLKVLDREKEVYETRIKHAELYYDTRFAMYSIMFTTGQLSPATLNIQ